eukprot:3901284-Pyramimonas_sp.AAC.1
MEFRKAKHHPPPSERPHETLGAARKFQETPGCRRKSSSSTIRLQEAARIPTQGFQEGQISQKPTGMP